MVHQLLSFKCCWLFLFFVAVSPAYAEPSAPTNSALTKQFLKKEALTKQVITLGTGGVTGLYYPTGGALCRLINQAREEHGIHCAVRSTLGSVSNLQQVINHELDMGIAEAGQIYNAFTRFKNNNSENSRFENSHSEKITGEINIKPDFPLRTLTSLYPEFISILVRSDTGINSFKDLKNKRINIGKLGTSQRSTLALLMEAHGWQLSDFAEVTELEPSEQAAALCDKRIDATLYVVGHPSGTIKEALRDCTSKLIGLSKHDRETLILRNPYYREMVISGQVYSPDLPDVVTVGVSATLFARADLPDNVAYAVVKSLFEQFDRFKKLHSAFRFLNPEQMMVSKTLPLPLHPGAAQYFEEVKNLLQIPPE